MQDRTKGFKKRGNPDWNRNKFTQHANEVAKTDPYDWFDSEKTRKEDNKIEMADEKQSNVITESTQSRMKCSQ